jgi:hypothetical protein
MDFTKHVVLRCHTCKRRHVSGDRKKGGSWDEAKRLGWVFQVKSTLAEYIWLCPTCARKHASTALPLGRARKKRG